MSRFLKPVDYNDDGNEDKSRLIRAKPIKLNFSQKLGNYAAGKDFVTGSMKSQQEVRESNVIVENDPKRGEMMDEKTILEQRNKLGAKILKAKLQGKMFLVKKLEKELHALREDGEGSSSVCKVLLRTDGGDVRIPATMKQERKDLKAYGTIDAIYHAEENIHDMVADEKETTSSNYIFNTLKAAAKHRAGEDWVVDDVMMAVKRTRKKEEKEKKRSRNNLIKDKFAFALLAVMVRIFNIRELNIQESLPSF